MMDDGTMEELCESRDRSVTTALDINYGLLSTLIASILRSQKFTRSQELYVV